MFVAVGMCSSKMRPTISGPPIWILRTRKEKGFDFDPVVLDMLLGHSPSGLPQIALVYNKHKFLAARRRAREEWAAFLVVELFRRVICACLRHVL